jgi:NAD(P)-dependent dehydrogenase (short-subunit alcohol dehydrogenase family)
MRVTLSYGRRRLCPGVTSGGASDRRDVVQQIAGQGGRTLHVTARAEGRVMRPVMLITGGSRGIGAATARLAAARGYDVVMSFRENEAAAEAVVAACSAAGAKAMAMRVDVAVERDVVELFEAAIGEFGRLDAAVNNAGTLHRAARLDEISVERLEEVTRINVIGAFVVAREAVRRMSTRHGGNGGSIVNVSSAAAYLGSPDEYIDYAATKGAVDTMTIGLSKEVATEGIRVNAVRPGLIYTDLHELSGIENRVDKLALNVPMQRGGQPEEVAEAILWLASPNASYVTGTFINTSGGR